MDLASQEGGRIGVNSVVEAPRSVWQDWVVGSVGTFDAHRGTPRSYAHLQGRYRPPQHSSHLIVGVLTCEFLQG